eukprot:m.120496 g.120496  ORF g.120496 m.120496 type:complete len:518 (+) comp21846_c0_seq2:174-1727(+)
MSVPRVRRTRLMEKYGLSGEPSVAASSAAAAPATPSHPSTTAALPAATSPTAAAGAPVSLGADDDAAGGAGGGPGGTSTVCGVAMPVPAAGVVVTPVTAPPPRRTALEVAATVGALTLTPPQAKVAATVLCLDLDAVIPEPLLVAVALGRAISDRQEAAVHRGEECPGEAIEWGETQAHFGELVCAQLTRASELLRVADGSPFQPTGTTPPGSCLAFPSQVPALAEWVAASGCVYRADPTTATALAARPDVLLSNDGGDAGPMWDALDALFALCGGWSSDTAQSATGTELHNVVSLVPHLRKVVGTLWTAKPRPSNKLLVQELAMTMFSTAVCEAAAAANMSAGREWCERALEVWTEATKDDDDGGHSDFVVKVTHHLGNQLLMLRKPEEALDSYARCLEAKKALDYPPYSLAVTHHQLGNVYSQLGRWNKATRMFKEADRIKSEDGSTDAVSRALTLGCLSVAHEQRGALQPAADAATRQLELLREAHTANLSDPSITTSLRRLFDLRKKLKSQQK